jgi:hypothetical protein
VADPSTPLNKSEKRAHSSPSSSAEDDKPAKKKAKKETEQPLILVIPRSVIDKALRGRSNAPRIPWSPVSAVHVSTALTSADVMARAQRCSWSVNSIVAFLNRYQYLWLPLCRDCGVTRRVLLETAMPISDFPVQISKSAFCLTVSSLTTRCCDMIYVIPRKSQSGSSLAEGSLDSRRTGRGGSFGDKPQQLSDLN